jgi:hypothetical protein
VGVEAAGFVSVPGDEAVVSDFVSDLPPFSLSMAFLRDSEG